MDLSVKIGRTMIAGSSALGMGAILYYGFGLSSEVPSFRKNLKEWPKFVRDRLMSVLKFAGISLAGVVTSQIIVCNIPYLLSLVKGKSLVFHVAVGSATIACDLVIAACSYFNSFPKVKITFWIAQTILQGIIVAPVLLSEGVVRHTLPYSLAAIFGVGLLSVTAPRGKFRGLKLVLLHLYSFVMSSSSLLSNLPLDTTAGTVLYSVTLYGGVIFFPVALLFFAQDAVVNCFEEGDTFDPLCQSLPLVSCAVNTFMRIALIRSFRTTVHFAELPITYFILFYS